jgi:predicted amidohydrolase YtcJ
MRKLVVAAVKIICAALLFAQSGVIHAAADMIFLGGPIVTVNAKNEEVEAIAVKDGKILAVGALAEINSKWSDPKTQVMNLNGRTLMPGFVEPHVHIVLTSMVEGFWLDLSNFTLPYDTIETLSTKLRTALKQVPSGGWLAGFGVDPSRTSPFMTELTAEVLDQVSKDVPIFIFNQSGHIAYVNNKAFEVAGVTNQTPNAPNGGIYVKDANGKLTGKLIEGPSYLPFQAKMPVPTQAEMAAAVRKTTKRLAMKGITTSAEITLGVNFGLENELGLFKYLMSDGGLPVRVRAYLYGNATPQGFNALKPNDGDAHLRFVGIKFVADGSTQGLTAALNEPYSYPAQTQDKGNLNYKTDTFFNLMKPYFDQGWQIAIHANGDSAVDQALENYSKLLDKVANPQTRRLRIEHFTISSPEQVLLTQKLGVVPGFTIGHVHYWGEPFHDHIVGAARANRIDPAASMKKEGVRFAFHSDTPVSPYGPLKYITQGVTRVWQSPTERVLGPDERISVDDAIRAVTIDAAYQLMSDHEVGSLEVGKLADFVVLEKNPRTTAPAQISEIKVLETWVGGKRQQW